MCHFRNEEEERFFWSTEKGYFLHALQKSKDTRTRLAQIKDVLTHCRDALKINEYKLGNYFQMGTIQQEAMKYFCFPGPGSGRSLSPGLGPLSRVSWIMSIPAYLFSNRSQTVALEPKHEPSPQDCLCWLWAAPEFYLQMSFIFIQPHFLSACTFLPVICVLCLALLANAARFSLHRVMSFSGIQQKPDEGFL